MLHKDDQGKMSDKLVTSLYLAVDLVDDYTDKRPMGNVSIALTNSHTTPIQNLSGYWLFLKSHDSENYNTNSSIVIKSSYYFDLVQPINLADVDPTYPVILISLIPRPNYPFPSHATLIRGMLADNKGKPISNAKISVDSTDITTTSTESGEFVLYSKDLEKKFKIKENFINNNMVVISLNIFHPDFKEKKVSARIIEGKSVSIVENLEVKH